MKKLALFILPVLFAFTSCKKTEYVTPNRTIFVNLSPGSWISSASGKNYTAAISTPEIDSYFNDHGAVLVYASFGSHIYEQIPEVYNGVSYSFTHRPGQVAIEIQSSDGSSVITPPGSMAVKIVLIESD